MRLKSKEVCILKAQIDDDEPSYSKVIGDAGFIVQSIPVLNFEFCNLETLKNYLKKPQDYSGIIFSSPRSVKAVSKCFGPSEYLPQEWQERVMFVVGEATKRTLMHDLGLLGQCGVTENAAGLAELIVQRSYGHPLLFPCSDIRRDTLPTLLGDKGIPLVEINVYCTKQNSNLEEIMKNTTEGGTEFPEFLVFFSPSGVKYTLPILLRLNAPLGDIKIVAIGNTTLLALNEANVDVWSCLSKPSPQCLLSALLGNP